MYLARVLHYAVRQQEQHGPGHFLLVFVVDEGSAENEDHVGHTEDVVEYEDDFLDGIKSYQHVCKVLDDRVLDFVTCDVDVSVLELEQGVKTRLDETGSVLWGLSRVVEKDVGYIRRVKKRGPDHEYVPFIHY